MSYESQIESARTCERVYLLWLSGQKKSEDDSIQEWSFRAQLKPEYKLIIDGDPDWEAVYETYARAFIWSRTLE